MKRDRQKKKFIKSGIQNDRNKNKFLRNKVNIFFKKHAKELFYNNLDINVSAFKIMTNVNFGK